MKTIQIIFLATLTFVLSASTLQAQIKKGELKENKTIIESISPEEKHAYTIHLTAQEFAFITVLQKGTDVAVTTFGPAGNLLQEFDTQNGKNGPEIVTISPEVTGDYTILVQPLEEQKNKGAYHIQINQKITKAATPVAQMEQLLSFWGEQGYLPGFATAIVTKDKILYQKGFGYADLTTKKPYTENTIQNIGSISKTLIGVSLMMLVEQGKLDLTTKVNDILPFEVINPHHPDIPITVEQLALHTSSIAEMDAYEKSYVLTEAFTLKKDEISKNEYKTFKDYEKNKAMPVGDFLKAVLAKDGEWYSKKSYLKTAPGEKYAYSNAAATLAAYIVEIITEESFDEFTKKHILQPLKMEHSGWSFEEVDMSQHSHMHFENHQVMPQYTLNTYPDGGLITSATELSLYLMEMIKGYYGEATTLKAETFQTMMDNHLNPSQAGKKLHGYFWEIRNSGEIGHNGGDPGSVNLMRFNPKTGIGKIFMANVLPSDVMALKQLRSVWRIMSQFEEEIMNYSKVK